MYVLFTCFTFCFFKEKEAWAPEKEAIYISRWGAKPSAGEFARLQSQIISINACMAVGLKRVAQEKRDYFPSIILAKISE